MNNRTLKYTSLAISVGIALLASGFSGCFPDPYSIGKPDSLFTEFVLVWDLVDSHYACFFAKEDVDWDEEYEKFRSEAINLGSRDQLVDLCLELMAELEDQVLILRDSLGTRLDSWNQGDFLNWDLSVWFDYMQIWTRADSSGSCVTFAASGATVISTLTPADSIGYVYISNLGDEFDMEFFYSVSCAVEHCNGVILDLRMCRESGIEVNAHYASGRFVDKNALSYYRAFRIGPGRNDMGEMHEVFTYKNGAWQFTKPIVLLTGRDTQGAGEQLVLLLKSQQHVTVIGDTTAGFASSAVSFNLTEGYSIEIPEVVIYSPDLTLVLNSGIAPDIYVPASEADFTAGVDPVLDAALEMIIQQ